MATQEALVAPEAMWIAILLLGVAWVRLAMKPGTGSE